MPYFLFGASTSDLQSALMQQPVSIAIEADQAPLARDMSMSEFWEVAQRVRARLPPHGTRELPPLGPAIRLALTDYDGTESEDDDDEPEDPLLDHHFRLWFLDDAFTHWRAAAIRGRMQRWNRWM